MSELRKKILKIMSEVDYLQKNEKIKFNTGSYSVISDEKVFKIIREKFVEHKLVLLPLSMIASSKEIGIVHGEHNSMIGSSTLTSVKIQYQLCDTESGECITIESCGQGDDRSDKGIGKAITYAYKTLMLKLFIIPTGDDPDKFGDETIGRDNPTFKAETKTEKSPEKLTIQIVGSVLTEYQINTNKDMNACKQMFIEPMGGKMLSEIKPENYSKLIDLIDDEYKKIGLNFKTPCLTKALEVK